MIEQKCIKYNEYTELLKGLLRISNKFSFVIRSDYTITENEKSVLGLFLKYLLFEDEVESWPGTVLYGKKARIFYYTFNQETFELLMKTSSDIYEWLHPEKPEDLCFYDGDKPVFASISHEHDSFLIENDGKTITEFEEIKQSQ